MQNDAPDASPEPASQRPSLAPASPRRASDHRPAARKWRSRPFVAIASLLLGLKLIATLSACVSTSASPVPATPLPFADYKKATYAQLQAGRRFQTGNHTEELSWNSPQEWLPADSGSGQKPARGILLVHGLGDSPWSFNDLVPLLTAQGFLVRTVLLPGHGTRPEDLQDASLEQWRQVVQSQAAVLQRDADEVFLGGFSTGANLVLEYAYAHPEIAGLLLFSPGFRASTSLDWLAPLVARMRPWLIAPDGRHPMQNSVRYLMTPTNGFAQFYRSSRSARDLLHSRPYEKPVFMAVSQNDSVLDTDYLLEVFQRRFIHPASRLIWYGDAPKALTDTSRVRVRTDRLPAQRISQFSHMGLLFSPGNPLYGSQGSARLCWNGQDDATTRACEHGATVWYSDWGYREADKVHARLTFNPYFNWQASVMNEVLASNRSQQLSQSGALTLTHQSPQEFQ